jgi:N utilization substance protein A
LAPAKVSKIIIDDDAHAMEVIVPDEQLSLAIGRKGQNVRLASRLTGWKIDVRSEAEAEEESRRAKASLTAIPGVNDIVAELLYQEGFKSAQEVAEADLELIQDVEGLTPEKAGAIHRASRELVAEIKQRELEAAELAAASKDAAPETADDAGGAAAEKLENA